ncbi:TonB-dependent receptor [Pseudidiomarina aestuarii]|uniref:TonB-dependent receptor n=1 Tax=Pseudidiomarina aestuarii TaxID=624146 RepID=A0A7Z7ETY7_9GAMM|nr:TonB-dependent receptor [Pseudidiomarina aestuarii]RUO41572.1 TonB-dependent receptor [Pseudidiomarina aestuarii]
MYTNNKLAKSIRLALMFGGASLAFSGSAIAQDQSEDEQAEEAQERITVTGSRIKRTDLEGAVPVTVIDREAIDLSGDISVADIIRNTTFNSVGSFRPQSGSSAQGVSQVDLRGLGASRSLVLVDGRRLTMSPSTGSSQDLNSIPIGAVERIEILSDGASAVYGSDAIGGVINVITRKDYNGAQLTLGAGEVSVPREGGDREQGSVLFGSSDANTQVLGGVSWNNREIVYENAYPWVVPGSSTYGNNWRSTVTGAFQGIPSGCTEENYIPTTIGGAPRCQYNFNATNANEASSANESLFIKARHQINNDWAFYSNASVAETESFGRYAPAPDSNIFYDGLTTPADSYNNPTNPNAWIYDPNNPNATTYDPSLVGPNIPVWFYHRFAAMGNRDTTVTNKNKDFMLGFEGMLGDMEVDFGYRRVRNNTTEIGNGYLAAQTAWTFVNDFNPGYCDDGSFNPTNCRYGYDLQFPSQNPDNVLAGGVVTTSRISDFDIDEYYANTSFDVTETNAGMIQAFVGFEHRKERYADRYDSQSEAGLVGGSAGNSAGGGRTVNAAFFEVLVPVTYDFELNFAGRYDRYSDFGGNFSPKVSFKWSISDDIIWRGSYGEGFRAPSLDILTQKTSFSADFIFDERTCTVLAGDPNAQCQTNAFYIANPDLSAENSTQFATGFAVNLTDTISMAIDYYNIEIEDRIRSFTSQNLIDALDAGDPIPAGLGVTRDANGVITEVTAGFGNEGTLGTSGFDFNLRANWDFADMGSLTQNLQIGHILDYSIDGGRNLVRDLGVPRNRLNFNNTYTLNDFTFAWNLSLIGDQYTDTVADANGADGVLRTGHLGSWVTHDLQATYNTAWDNSFTLGVQNAFEKLPTLEPYGGRDYNYGLYNGWGRVFYVRFQQNF